MLWPVANVMKEIGYKKAIVVHGTSENGDLGMDEASTLGETFVVELMEDGTIINYSFFPEDLGIERGNQTEIASLNNLEQEAIRMVALLKGRASGSREDIVCLNAALVLYLMNHCGTIKEGVEKAKELIHSGKAITKLREWVQEQNHEPQNGLSKLEQLTQKALA